MTALIFLKCFLTFALYSAPAWVPITSLALYLDRLRRKRRVKAAKKDFRIAYQAWKTAEPDPYTDAANLYQIARNACVTLNHIQP